jgi:bifunctional DNA-binding transcriptional regulator/antitoxin component of YhaV-PrlF toxin-antitoxin module
MRSAITKVGPKYQVTTPQGVRTAVGLEAGGLVQASVGADGAIVLRRQLLVDYDRELEKQLKAAQADVKAGRVLGPFDTARDAVRALKTWKRRADARNSH